MRTKLIGVFLGLTAIAGCQYRPTPVTLAGDPSSIRALAGTWIGTYRGTDTQRSGSITFAIRVAGDSAFGDVYMQQPPGAGVVVPADDPRAHRAHARSPQLLAVSFVAVQGGEINGELEPYIAPDCECRVNTRFNGRVYADTIRGTYVTRGSVMTPQNGEWSVVRTTAATSSPRQ